MGERRTAIGVRVAILTNLHGNCTFGRGRSLLEDLLEGKSIKKKQRTRQNGLAQRDALIGFGDRTASQLLSRRRRLGKTWEPYQVGSVWLSASLLSIPLEARFHQEVKSPPTESVGENLGMPHQRCQFGYRVRFRRMYSRSWLDRFLVKMAPARCLCFERMMDYSSESLASRCPRRICIAVSVKAEECEGRDTCSPAVLGFSGRPGVRGG